MKKIALTQGKFALVDDQDYEFLSQWKWYYARGYAVRTQNNYPNKPYQVRMHKVILNTPKGFDTDHRNGQKNDNRRSNLRVATRSQNGANIFSKKQNKSGYKGVSWKKANKKWCVQLTINGVVVHIGLFIDIKDAARAYNLAAKKFHGEFARLNKV